MNINFRNRDAFVNHIVLDKNEGEWILMREIGDIPTAKDISGIEIRLTKALVKDNGTPKIWPLPGLASMYLVIIVISDLDNPVQNLDIKGFAKVDDNEELPVDRTIFFWKKGDKEKVPSQVHVFASMIKSKEGLTNVSTALQQVKDDQEYKTLTTSITNMVNAATPVGAIADTLFSIAGIMGKYLGNVKDKPWITYVQSFTDINGDWDNVGSITRGVENDRGALTLKLIVRDKNREQEILERLMTGEDFYI